MSDKPKPEPATSKAAHKPFRPNEKVPDTLEVPPNTIYLVCDHSTFLNPPHFQKLGKNRDWFTPFFYFCLPLVFGNEHGFIMTATYDFVVRWDGSDGIEGVDVHLLEEPGESNFLTISSHFGSGILTIQSRYAFRTPKNVNLMVKEPPNYPIDGFSWMNAVVETDNLRRDFTFNIKITRPHLDIYIRKGTPLGCIVPYPRYFLDKYALKVLKDEEQLAREQQAMKDFAKERTDYDFGKPRLRYMEGRDIYDHMFEHHQKSLDSGAWWQTVTGNKHTDDKTKPGNSSASCPFSNPEEKQASEEKRPWWKKIFTPD